MHSIQTWKTSRALLTILAVAALMLAMLAHASLSRSAFAQNEGFVCVEVNLDDLLTGTVTVNDTALTVDATLLAQLTAGTGPLIEADLIAALEAGEPVDLVVDGTVITDINPAENCAADEEVIVCVQLALEDLLAGEITVNGDALTVNATLLAQLTAGTGPLLEAGLIDALEAGEPVNLVVENGEIVDINLGEDCVDDGQDDVLVCVQLTLADLLTGAITIDGELDLTVDAELLAQLTAGTGALLEDGLVADLEDGAQVNLVVVDGVIVDVNPGEKCVADDQQGE